MPDLSAGPVLRLPEDLMRVAEIVAAEFQSHERHAWDRALADAAARLRGAACEVSAGDPLVAALTRSCHVDAGAVHADPRVVAAAAYRAVAALLEPSQPAPLPDFPLTEKETTHGS